MPITRDPRVDRRRRVLRDGREDAGGEAGNRRAERNELETEEAELQPKRGAGYSQEVRRACGQRLVQFIPVRKFSYTCLVLLSAAIPALLLIGHYMIYVSGSLKWYGHPLAVSLDASHQSSIAAWFSSHLWLLCLGATLLTFQLRRHKLDDYNGEYRLWFWLVLTCLAASIDSTTHISELFGLALDRWSQINLGWSGPAVVQATLAALIGMLGLRLCTELKSVPLSLVFWLGGLTAWACSAALGQEELRLDMSLQFRIWFKAALWLGGLTAIWLAALTYLRSVYIDAQQRFLARGGLAASGLSLSQRFRSGWSGFSRSQPESSEAEPAQGVKRKAQPNRHARQPAGKDATTSSQRGASPSGRAAQTAGGSKSSQAADQQTDDEAGSARRSWNPFARRAKSESESEVEADSSNTKPSPASSRKPSDATADDSAAGRRGLAGWLRKPKDEDDAEEFQKVKSAANSNTEQQTAGRRQAESEPEKERSTGRLRNWFARAPKSDDLEAAAKSPRQVSSTKTASQKSSDEAGQPATRRWFQRAAKAEADSKSSDSQRPRRGLLARFKLQPPEDDQDESAPAMREVPAQRPLPGTSSERDSDEQFDRPLTKAERKRLRRQQRQNHAA